MPLLQVSMLEGRSDEQKEALVEALTKACVDAMGSKPETVTILITDVPTQHWAVAGQSFKKKLAQK